MESNQDQVQDEAQLSIERAFIERQDEPLIAPLERREREACQIMVNTKNDCVDTDVSLMALGTNRANEAKEGQQNSSDSTSQLMHNPDNSDIDKTTESNAQRGRHETKVISDDEADQDEGQKTWQETKSEIACSKNVDQVLDKTEGNKALQPRNYTTKGRQRIIGKDQARGKRMMVAGNNSEAGRELLSASQCSSQASTSFISSSCFISGDNTTRSNSSESIAENAGVIRSDEADNKSQASGAIASLLMAQTIDDKEESHQMSLAKHRGTATSRSMLNLDQAVSGHEKFQVIWQNLTFSYGRNFWARNNRELRLCGRGKKKAETLPVLRDISGQIESNKLVAVIGPSGCGKTTLLQFLAGNRASQQERMRIIGLDEPKVAFIGQDDSLLPGLTASETLMYASLLQNNRPNFNHREHIQPILNELGLEECAHRDVNKLSGGQAKRVTIAQELLYPTNLLILDEVTSGLDASTSYSIVKLLKYLVSDSSYPMSIVMSIHQPSARLFSVFDRVYVMSEGYCLYEGGCQVEEINNYLALFQLQCPKFHNIADYLIEIACYGNTNSQDDILSLDNDLISDVGQHGRSNDVCKIEAITNDNDSNTIYSMKQKMVEYQREKNQHLLASAVKEQYKQEQKHKFAPFPKQQREEQLISMQPSQETSLMMQQEQTMSLLMNKNDNNHHSSSSVEVGTDQHQMLHHHDGHQSLYAAIERSRGLRVRPFFNQFLLHFGRSSLRIRRSLVLTYLQLATYIILGLQLATFYGPEIGSISGCPSVPANLMSFLLAPSSELDSNQQQEEASHEMRRIQENMNFLLVAVLLTTFAALEMTVITFPLEAKTVKREWRNGWYRVTSYFLGRTLSDLPFTLVFVTIFTALIYSLTSQMGLFSWRFGVFLAVVVMTALIAQSYGFIFGALFMDNLPAAVFVAPLALFPSLLFSGFFSRVSQVPALYKPMTIISHFRYVFDALLIALYGYNRCECEQSTLDYYHNNLHNQTDTMRDMFYLMFGSISCEQSGSSSTTPEPPGVPPLVDNMISHEDASAIRASNASLAAIMTTSMADRTSTVAPPTIALMSSSATKSLLVEAIVDNLFDHMTNKSATHGDSNPAISSMMAATNGTPLLEASTGGLDETQGMTALDRLSYKFSNRVTQMLSKQSNFGRTLPHECKKFNSYLLQEFDLHDEDLVHCLLMLALFVLVSRLICNLILNFTIATRAR